MLTITLPDGAKREVEDGSSAMDVAKSISKSLAKKVLAAKINGALWDATRPLESDCTLELVTAQDPEGVELIRHDCAHVMAEAVQELFPGTQVTIGPVIENGFYYDFASENPFSEEDFAAIEKKMKFIIQQNKPFVREVWDRDEAIAYFTDKGEAYKAELITDLPKNETITVYKQGEWLDLCLGPHLPSTGKVGTAFKLTKVAGAYWRGDSHNAQLQRIYGTAWANQEDLDAHLHRLEEAEKRDHRKLGREMELFHFQEEAQGQAFWHEKGWTLYRTLQEYMRRRQIGAGYSEINTPELMDQKFWKASGHWDKYRENMFITQIDDEDKVLALKPMNCPCHVQVFNHGQRSYKDLPLRLAEFGSCHRYEPSGALHGLMRVRAFTQDDGHIFCREDQVIDEVKGFCALLQSVYADLGFDDVIVRFSDRPDVRVGSDEVWDRAEKALRDAADATGLEVEYNPGDGAFYGPKLDFVLRDAIGREWQTGTIQADFNLPERLDASYIGSDDAKHRPVMLHRAILGSFERFLGVLIEHYAGRFPLWLAPTQVVVATITSEADDYAHGVVAKLRAAGLRVNIDTRNEKINYKVREHSVGKIPVIAVVGKKEAEEGKLALRFLGDRKQEFPTLDEAIVSLGQEATPPDLRS
ncbi:MAG TPA: threonine--tRNA ligase [Hellea balneolensis]|uniref:Threonine--tRNA ligase n=1 Tax=Hellea balneolensis TaxID=287478 RepID=A0A7C3GM45_9PROT|nr:threonine--tRNA ligase [Hellea balneolensis]